LFIAAHRWLEQLRRESRTFFQFRCFATIVQYDDDDDDDKQQPLTEPAAICTQQQQLLTPGNIATGSSPHFVIRSPGPDQNGY